MTVLKSQFVSQSPGHLPTCPAFSPFDTMELSTIHAFGKMPNIQNINHGVLRWLTRLVTMLDVKVNGAIVGRIAPFLLITEMKPPKLQVGEARPNAPRDAGPPFT